MENELKVFLCVLFLEKMKIRKINKSRFTLKYTLFL